MSDILILLLRLALGESDCKVDLSALSERDWCSLVDLAFDQGVAAISVDGLQRFYDANPGVELELDKEESEGLKYEWFGETLQSESDFSRHNAILAEMVKTLSEQNIRILLLKGLGLSKYYPVPSHRPTGDFDIYSYGHHLEVDKYFADQDIAVDNSHQKHSVFKFRGETVENHYIYLDSYVTKCEKKVQDFLESLDDDVLDEGGYYTPSPLKNYFFLLCHMARHFSEFESIRLRHMLDWGLFLKAESGRLDLALVREKLRELGLERTNDLFVSLAERVCGFDFSDFLFERLPEKECSEVLEYILTEKKRAFPQQLIPRFWDKLRSCFEIIGKIC